MSLLDKANTVVTVYPEETIIDQDGNVFTRPSTEGTETPAMVSPRLQSGTSSRRAEQDNGEGFFTEEFYQLRFPRGSAGEAVGPLGPRSYVEWNGQRWGLFGFPIRYDRSRGTRRLEYTMIRN